jgi:hypothetical protein
MASRPKFKPDGSCTCGHDPQPDIHAPGYGVRKDGTTYCIDCWTESQRAAMERDGKATLLLSPTAVHNEANTLRFDVIDESRTQHNIARGRRDVWFIGPDGMRWGGAHFGAGTGKVTVRRATGLHQLREQLKALGMSLYLRSKEYRVNYRHGAEETAYYTTDPLDAFRKAKQMAEERDKPKPLAMEWE